MIDTLKPESATIFFCQFVDDTQFVELPQRGEQMVLPATFLELLLQAGSNCDVERLQFLHVQEVFE